MPPRPSLFLALAASLTLSAALAAPTRASDASLILGGGGFLYGKSSLGGAKGHGFLFRLRRDGSGFRVLHGLRAARRRGLNPYGEDSPAGRTDGHDGYYYSASQEGGEYGEGVIFRRHWDGTGFALLHSFCFYDTDQVGANYGGAAPESALLARGDGFLYGTAHYGGGGGRGVVFRLRASCSVSAGTARASKSCTTSARRTTPPPCTSRGRTLSTPMERSPTPG